MKRVIFMSLAGLALVVPGGLFALGIYSLYRNRRLKGFGIFKRNNYSL